MIKAIIFDVGGVLLRTEDHAPRRHWEERLGLEAGGLEAIVLNSPQGKAAQLGEVSQEQHWRWVGAHFGLDDAAARRLEQDFWAGDRLDLELVALIRGLKQRYQTAIISNYMDGLRRELREGHAIADAFDLIVISSEEGVAKPDPRIFEVTLERLGRQPGECVFIDDFAHNIAGAEAVGLQGVHYRAGMDVAGVLRGLGVEV
jgi:HAD superfamily hydrolase (TIGR01509 family)